MIIARLEKYDDLFLYAYIHMIYHVCIYIYGTPPKKKTTFLRSQRFWDKLPCSVSVPVGGTIYIYKYTYVCINCCLTVEPRCLEQFCHQKRLQTFANESRGPSTWTGSGFKIQDPRSKIQDSRSKIQDSKFKIQDSRFKIQKKLLESRG